LLLLLSLSLHLQTSLAHAEILAEKDYGYPFRDPYLATVTAAADHASAPFKISAIEIRPDRAHVPLLEGRHKISLGIFKQNHQAPLVFVIAGVGGTALSGSALMLAEGFYNAGFNAVTLPDPLSWQYTLGVSESATPGFVARDSKEYYGFMRKVNWYLKNSEGLEVSSYSLVGFSLGGLLSGFLAREDEVQRVFNFKKVIMINPAMDVGYGIAALDHLYDVGKVLSPERKSYDIGLVLNIGEDIIEAPLSQDTFKSIIPKIRGIKSIDIQWLIGESFREDLRDVIYTSQQVHDTGILKKKADRWHQNAREDEAHEISFAEYMGRLVLPTLPEMISSSGLGTLLYQTSFYSLRNYIKGNKNIYIFENADDFILQKSDADVLKDTFGERLYLYPCGGHLGNLWFERNKRDLHKVLLAP